MKRLPLLFMLFYSGLLTAQQLSLSKEIFVDSIYRRVVDSGFSKYYLAVWASPCRFKVFDYDQLVKYSLKETVSLGVLNELAGNSYRDSVVEFWKQEKLINAICVSDDQIRAILNPAWQARYDPTLGKKERKRAIRNALKRWDHKPREEKLVFYFSRPVFTADHDYAAIDLDVRCDTHECGMLTTYLFRRDKAVWKTIGVISGGGS